MNNRNNTIYLILFIIGAALMACEKEIDLDLGTPNQQLVVEGRIERAVGSTPEINRLQVRLTLLADFFANVPAPPATGATVWVTTPGGNLYDYQEAEPGLYVTNGLVAQAGQTYTLHIEWLGQSYQATETVSPVPPIDAIYQVFEEENLFEDGGLKVAIDFQDMAGVPNYYFWETYVNDTLRVLPDPGNSRNLIAKDEFFDGQTIEGYFPNEELVVTPGQQVVVRQIGLSEQAYQYYFLLFDQAGKTGQLIDTPPATVRGNVRNLTDAQNKPLGYFFAAEVAELNILITE